VSSLVTRRKQNDLLTLNCPDVLRLLITLHIAQNFVSVTVGTWRSQWPRGLRRGSSAVRLMGLQVRISPEPWMSVCCDCRVLSGRGLRRAHHPSRAVLPNVACVCVWSWNLKNEKTLAQ